MFQIISNTGFKHYNIKEESDENTEEQVRNLFVAKLRIPQNDVDAIRFERVHRIPVKPSSQRSQSRGPRPVIVRFSHYQNKEFVRSFYKNLKGTKIGISDDFPREVEEIHKNSLSSFKTSETRTEKGFLQLRQTNHKWPNLQRRRDQEPPLLWKHYEKLRIIPWTVWKKR